MTALESTTAFGRCLFKIAILFLLSTCIDGVTPKKRISVNLGLNDADAVVGKIFHYTIPNDAFDGDLDHYEVTEAGGSSLPKWLVWNPETSTFTGIPSQEDLGPNYVQVTAVGQEDAAKNPTRMINRVKDVFSIHVYDEFRLPSERIPYDDRLSCDDGPSTVVTLTLGIDFNAFSAAERLEVITAASKAFHISQNVIRLFPNDDESFTSLKRTILLASALPSPKSAENTEQESSGSEAVLIWKLNCDANATADLEDASFDQLRNYDESGTLKEALDSTVSMNERSKERYPIVAWHVSSITYEPKRRRRQAGYVTPNSNMGATGATWAVDVTIPTTSARSQPPTRTPTIRIRPSGFVTTGVITATSTPSSTSRRTATTTSSTSSRRTATSTSRTSPTTTPTTSFTRTRTTMSTTRKLTTTTSTEFDTVKPGDSTPTLKNSMGARHCRQKTVCVLNIPPNTFYDKEDGYTRNLTLRLEADDDFTKQSSWLHLNQSNQVLFGYASDAGIYQYALIAKDSGNRFKSTGFFVNVSADLLSNDNLHHRIMINFTAPKNKNSINDVKIAFVQRLAEYFNDPTPEHIRVNSFGGNSFVLSWSNISLPMDHCPEKELKKIQMTLFQDGRLDSFRKNFTSFMKNFGFGILNGQFEFSGVCEGRSTTVFANTTLPATPPPPSTTTAAPPQDNLFVATILPAIIIAVFLIVATLVACILYRRNRRHKKHRAESKSEFVSKGTPIIFPDEVDLDKESTAATPMLLKDEKPPLQPLDFAVGNGGADKPNGNGTGNGSHMRSPLITKPPSGPGRVLGKTHVSEAETELWQRPLLQDMDENPMYRPPPAFEPAGLKENRSPRPKHASPQQRDPPPYVPP